MSLSGRWCWESQASSWVTSSVLAETPPVTCAGSLCQYQTQQWCDRLPQPVWGLPPSLVCGLPPPLHSKLWLVKHNHTETQIFGLETTSNKQVPPESKKSFLPFSCSQMIFFPLSHRYFSWSTGSFLHMYLMCRFDRVRAAVVCLFFNCIRVLHRKSKAQKNCSSIYS